MASKSKIPDTTKAHILELVSDPLSEMLKGMNIKLTPFTYGASKRPDSHKGKRI